MAELGGMIASAVGEQIDSKLSELVKEEVALLWGFRDDVEAMEEKMKDLEALMHDADDRLRRGERDGKAFGRWLMKFKDVVYDVEDVLDELDANELISKTQSKFKLFFSRNNQLLQRISIAHNMKSLKGKIGKIEIEGCQTLNLVPRKSTMAESVLADERVNIFNFQAWVHVSEQFDLRKIEEDGNKLEELKRVLQYGCKGSKIIVTTCNQSVVAKMSTGVLANHRIVRPVPESKQVKLGILSSEDCWQVMKQMIFGPDEDQSGLEEVGREIAAKCGGVPLIANSLGRVLSELRTVKEWEDIRDTKIDLGSRDQKDTLERLMLSYYYMKLEFKLCFTYLAAFPKGFVMDGDRLIQQWIALGYIHAKDDGERCIKYLLGMSFLQISRSSSRCGLDSNLRRGGGGNGVVLRAPGSPPGRSRMPLAAARAR
ncbi:hypothetical protein BRADI_2g41930v3 [Brachypodium distachyon]|uniref:Rx N-terminal domain-containing protein n=1 Tax=Brachypodium distachyon TaxID=15368 RepID=A0A0Q3GD71_BRADI|nr:hypothetical protein BRADI_2g41930v3 [Brachypodium distachyon]